MGVRNSPDILQYKINELFRGFDLIQEYIDVLLIKTKGDWYNLLENFIMILHTLKENGIKCKVKNLYFGTTKMEYLIFWLTWNIIRTIKSVRYIKNDATKDHAPGVCIYRISKIL